MPECNRHTNGQTAHRIAIFRGEMMVMITPSLESTP